MRAPSWISSPARPAGYPLCAADKVCLSQELSVQVGPQDIFDVLVEIHTAVKHCNRHSLAADALVEELVNFNIDGDGVAQRPYPLDMGRLDIRAAIPAIRQEAQSRGAVIADDHGDLSVRPTGGGEYDFILQGQAGDHLSSVVQDHQVIPFAAKDHIPEGI